MRTFRRGETGEGQLGCIVGLLVLLAASFVAYKMIPVKVKSADFRQTVVNESKAAGIHGDKQIRGFILEKARELDLPVTDKDIKINRSRSAIKVEVKYTIYVDFPGYRYKWDFDHTAENPIF